MLHYMEYAVNINPIFSVVLRTYEAMGQVWLLLWSCYLNCHLDISLISTLRKVNK